MEVTGVAHAGNRGWMADTCRYSGGTAMCKRPAVAGAAR